MMGEFKLIMEEYTPSWGLSYQWCWFSEKAANNPVCPGM